MADSNRRQDKSHVVENQEYWQKRSLSSKVYPMCLFFSFILIIRLAPWAGKMNRNSRAVIGYPSGQDGAILPARDTGFVPQGKFIMFWCFIPYNKSFIDQACSVKMAGYWPRSFFACMDLDFVSVHKHAKKELGQYPAILTEQAWSITHTYCRKSFLSVSYDVLGG